MNGTLHNRAFSTRSDVARFASTGSFGHIRSLSAVVVLALVFGPAFSASGAPPRRFSERLDGVAPSKSGPGSAPDRAKAPVVNPSGPRPIIIADEPVHDFGPIWVGPQLKHTFILRNTGTVTLNITRVKPSCGCTVAGTYPKKIEPGKTGAFPFSVASTKLRGKFEKAITVTSDDPSNPNLRLRLRGQVKRYVDVVPAALQFGKLYGGKAQERIVRFTNNTEKPMELTLDGKPDGNFEVKLTATEPGQKYELRVIANPPFESGAFRKSIKLKTNVEQQKAIVVDIRGIVPARLDVSPSVLTVNTKAGGKQATTRIVRFTNYGADPAKLLGATTDDPKISVQVRTQTEGKAYSVQVQFPSGYVIPATGRTLTLKTDDPKRPTITVPIRGLNSRTAKRNQTPRRRPAEALVGKRAPKFSVKSLDGKILDNASMRGNVTVLDFFAVNCGFCKKQIPRMETIRKEYEGKGVRFVAMSQTMRSKTYNEAQVMDKLKECGYRGEVVTDPGNVVGPLFKASSFPTMVLIGKKGKVEAVNIGNVGDLEARMRNQLNAMLAGKPVPAIKKLAANKPKPAPRKRPGDMIGKKVAAFSTTTFDGKALGNSQFAEHPATILNFVATNCGYCKKQIPRLEKMRQKFEAKGVRFVNVVETMRKASTKDQVIEKMKGLGSHLEVAHDPGNKIGPLFNASGFPTMVLVGKSGKVEAVNIGNIGDLETRLEKQLTAMIAGKPIPKIAGAPRAQRKTANSLIGKPAPAFAIKTLDKKPMSSAQFKEHPATVLNFVAGNCGYCKKQIPRLEKLRQTYESKGIRFVNVVQTMRTPFTEEQIIEKMTGLGSKMENAHDPKNTIGSLYSATGFPTMVIVGKSGKVEAVNVGNIGDLEKRVSSQLDALIAGKPLPKVAAAPSSNRRPAMGLVGKMAPKISLKTLGGKSVSNADFKTSGATVLNFVAPNCGYCKRQIPNIEKIRKQYEAKGVRFVNVVQKMRKDYTEEQILDVFKGVGSGLEITTGDFKTNAAGGAYLARSFPTMIVVDRSGKIANVNIGAKANLDTLLSGQLDAILK